MSSKTHEQQANVTNPIFTPTQSPFLVPFDGSFDLAAAPHQVPTKLSNKDLKKQLKSARKQIAGLQEKLYADNRYSVLLVFQAMDAAGKDSTIKAVLKGVNPAGCQVESFKQPSKNELEHDFLWRTTLALPRRGNIGVFNRSHYEETLVVQVHPEYLGSQNLPQPSALPELWEERYESIRDHERHLANNGTVILKFWLNVSPQEQRKRFISRLETPGKHWKYSAGDLDEAKLWDEYMHTYQETLNATSCEHAPWYAIPADNKAVMRAEVASIIAERMASLNLDYPTVDIDAKAELAKLNDC